MSYKYPWQQIKEYKEILFHKYEGIARISINRPEVHNAFTPLTVQEMIDAMLLCREDESVGVIILTGEGGKAFCSGGDQSVRGHGGYVGSDTVPRLNVLDLQKIIRSISKPVIAAVAGWAIGAAACPGMGWPRIQLSSPGIRALNISRVLQTTAQQR